SVALDTQAFARAIERPAAIVDIGGGSLQISLFDKDTLVSTQNFRMGVLRMRSTLDHIGAGIRRYDQLVTELVSSQLSIFTKMIVKDRRVENIVLLDDYVSPVISRLKTGGEQGVVNAKQFVAYIDDTLNHSSRETAKLLDISEDNVQLMYISGLLVKCIISHLGAETLWAPGVTLCDGIAYEYAEERGLLVEPHDFEQDIVACARNIAKRYQGSKSRSETLQAICLAIFDAMGETHGLGGRERLLLQIATILHDCGKYINLINLAECSYNIILSTEIIGLSHRERAIVANVVRYNHEEFDYYESTAFLSRGLDHDAYLIIAKLTAILRIANALDRTHKQKFRNVRIQVEEGRLVIQVDTNADITLEKGLFGNRAAFFEQIYGLKPVVIQKRLL
ncbi:MAG: HD domain-containing protein, partial [Butyrivibrio sp.]|nr:HD domain-containing protein [Butyrivibrio sp.]